MKKIFSFLTAILFAGSLWATDFTNLTFTFNTASVSGWSTTGTFNNSYFKFDDGDYAQTTDVTTIIPEGEVLSTDMSVVIGCGTFQTWSNPKSIKATVQLLDNSANVLSSANKTFSGLAGNVNAQEAITVSIPESPESIASLKIILSDFNSTSTGCARFGSVKLTYSTEETGSACDKKVTLSSGETTNGTFTLDQSGVKPTCDAELVVKVTPKPASHYHTAEVTATNSTSITGPDEDGKYTVTYAQNTNAESVITVTFAEDANSLVTWNNNGETSTSKVYHGAKPTFPNPNPTSFDETSTTFYGWATAAWSGVAENLESELLSGITIYRKASDMPAVSAPVTYYAVFVKKVVDESWTETALASLTTSDVFVMSAGTYAINNNGGTTSQPKVNVITVKNSAITSEVTDTLKWNVSGNSTDGYIFYPYGSTTTWLYCNTTASSSSNNNIRVGTGDRKVWKPNASGYLVTNDTYTARYLSLYNDSDFRGYTSNSSAFVPKFYKLTDNSTYSLFVTTKPSTPTAVDNTEASVKAVKVLREGQIFILRGDKVYTVQGQLVK